MYLFNYFILLGLSMLLIACNADKASVEKLYPNEPDTISLIKLANFLSDEDVIRIAKSDNKMDNYKGVKEVPQDRDDFRFDTLDDLYWKGIHSIKSDFRAASFRSSDCSEADFSGSDFRVADIRWTSFFFSNMDSCMFSQSKMFHVYGTGGTFNNCDFRGANMFGMEAHAAQLKNCNFSNALMKDTEFTDSDFTGSTAINVRFIRAVMDNVKLDTMDLSYSDFTGASLKKTTFINSRLLDVNFQGAHCQNADFSGADLKGANFFGTEFKDTKFVGAINIPSNIKHMIKEGIATGTLQVQGE